MKKPEENFSKQADLYAIYRPEYPDDMIKAIVSLCKSFDLCWDAATGNGQAAVKLSKYFKKIIATDISDSQLKNAQYMPNIEYRKSASESTDIADSTIDLITVAQALHWFDFEKFYQEVKRVGKKESVLCAWGYGLHSLENSAADTLLFHFYSQIVGAFWPSGREHIESAYTTIPFPFEKIQMPSFQILKNWTFDEYVGYLHTWSAVQKYKDTNGTDPLEKIIGSLSEIWGDKLIPRKISFPVFILAGKI